MIYKKLFIQTKIHMCKLHLHRPGTQSTLYDVLFTQSISCDVLFKHGKERNFSEDVENMEDVLCLNYQHNAHRAKHNVLFDTCSCLGYTVHFMSQFGTECHLSKCVTERINIVI